MSKQRTVKFQVCRQLTLLDSFEDNYTFIDWEKVYNNEEFVEISEKLRNKSGRYGDEIVLISERDKHGRLVPKMADNEVFAKIAFGLSVQLDNWNESLPDEEKVYLHETRSSCGFNDEEILLPDAAVSLVIPTAEEMDNSVSVPLRSPNFVVEICRHSKRNELLRKIRESYLVEGTNTAVVLLICWTRVGSNYNLEMEFYVADIDEPVLGPIWRDWEAEEIPELAAIIPGFVLNCQSIMNRLRNYRRR